MLKKLTIHNFRSCQDLELDDFGQILLLVGKNGVGKTNILKAVQWACRIASSPKSVGEKAFEVSHIELTLELDGEDYQYAIESNLEESRTDDGNILSKPFLNESLVVVSSKGVRRSIFRKNGETLFIGEGAHQQHVNTGLTTPSAFAAISLLSKHETISSILKFLDFATAVKYYPLVEIEDSKETTGAFLTTARYEALKAGVAEPKGCDEVLVKILSFYLSDHAKFDELKALVGRNGLDVIEKIRISSYDFPMEIERSGKSAHGEEQKENKIYFIGFAPSMHNGSSVYQYDSLSFGTKRILRMVVNLLYDAAAISLIEQPEDGIHPGLLYKLLPLLRLSSAARQCLIASHSSEILNAAEPREVRLVEMDRGTTRIRSLTEDELEAAEEFLDESGPFSDFVRALQE